MEIFLVYMMAHVMDARVSNGPNVSERIFTTYEECTQFVNTLASSDVFDGHKFQFVAQDGVIFYGGCFTKEEQKEFTDGLRVPHLTPNTKTYNI